MHRGPISSHLLASSLSTLFVGPVAASPSVRIWRVLFSLACCAPLTPKYFRVTYILYGRGEVRRRARTGACDVRCAMCAGFAFCLPPSVFCLLASGFPLLSTARARVTPTVPVNDQDSQSGHRDCTEHHNDANLRPARANTVRNRHSRGTAAHSFWPWRDVGVCAQCQFRAPAPKATGKGRANAHQLWH